MNYRTITLRIPVVPLPRISWRAIGREVMWLALAYAGLIVVLIADAFYGRDALLIGGFAWGVLWKGLRTIKSEGDTA